MSARRLPLLALALTLAAGQAFATENNCKHGDDCCKQKKNALSAVDAAEVKLAVDSAFAIEHAKFDGSLTAEKRNELEQQGAGLAKAIKERGKIDPYAVGKEAEKSCSDKKACGHSSLDGASKVLEGGCNHGKKAI